MRMLAETGEWKQDKRAIAASALKDNDALVRRAAADALGRHPSRENISPLLELLKSTPPEDVQLRYQARVALRNQLRDASILAGINSLALSKEDLRTLLDITPAVAAPQAAAFEIEHLDLVSADRVAVTNLLRHAMKYPRRRKRAKPRSPRCERRRPRTWISSSSCST